MIIDLCPDNSNILYKILFYMTYIRLCNILATDASFRHSSFRSIAERNNPRLNLFYQHRTRITVFIYFAINTKFSLP